MVRHLNIHTPTAFSRLTAIALISLFSAACATHPPAHTVAVINRGEQLIATNGSEPTPPTAGPAKSVDSSKEHLVEIYNGQQKIIERMEAKRRKKEEEKRGEREINDIAENQAAPLPDDISPTELLRIIEKQQSLIQALSSSSRN